MQEIKHDINNLNTKIKFNKGSHINLIPNVKKFIVIPE